MQCPCYYSSQDVAAGYPGKKDGRERFQSQQRGKSEEDANSHTAGYGLGCVANRQQLQRMLVQPAVQVKIEFLQCNYFLSSRLVGVPWTRHPALSGYPGAAA